MVKEAINIMECFPKHRVYVGVDNLGKEKFLSQLALARKSLVRSLLVLLSTPVTPVASPCLWWPSFPVLISSIFFLQVGVWDERFEVIQTIRQHGSLDELQGIEDVFVFGRERETADIVAVPRKQLNQHKLRTNTLPPGFH